eukprot:6731623-Prymnesium_polylepis.1
MLYSQLLSDPVEPLTRPYWTSLYRTGVLYRARETDGTWDGPSYRGGLEYVHTTTWHERGAQ